MKKELEEEFVPYEEALALRKLGFKEECFARYSWKANKVDTDLVIMKTPMYIDYDSFSRFCCVAPLYQQAFRWFRSKGYDIEINSLIDINNERCYQYIIKGHLKTTPITKEEKRRKVRMSRETIYSQNPEVWDTSEEAELACLRQLIEIVKKQQL